MIHAVFLDSGPLGLVTKRHGIAEADACRQWVSEMNRAGILVMVPEIADYEVRPELIRASNLFAVRRLDIFNQIPGRYLTITTSAIRKAAELWAEARNMGYATADAKALDGDVIVAAQALVSGFATSEFLVATDNVNHLARYVPANDWRNISP